MMRSEGMSVRLEVEFERDAEPASGRLTDAAGRCAEFSGMLELIGLLDSVRVRGDLGGGAAPRT